MTSLSASTPSPVASAADSTRRVAGLVLARPHRRAVVDRVMRGLTAAATVLILIPLVALVGYVTVNALPWIDLEFLTSGPVDFVHGGALNAILGSLQLVPLATLVAAPIGILAGVFLAEIAPPRLANAIRFGTDVMVGLPSVVVGVFCYALLVVPFHGYSAMAGIVALTVIMVPVIARNTEEILRLVPASVREGALALGMPRWRVILTVLVRAGLGGLVTGIVLAVARGAGETAPLLLTALGSRLVNVGRLTEPIDTLPTFIYTNSGQPSPVLVGQAWAAALILLIVVLTANIVVRVLTRRRSSGGRTR
jgi:phosphate transport system permease protein